MKQWACLFSLHGGDCMVMAGVGEERGRRAEGVGGMSHESKSRSLGMISTATHTTATVNPLTPLANGSAAAQSAHSGFAAALRQLAKQAEDPRGSSPNSESPVSSPATSLSSPVNTPKRGLSGPLQTRGHSLPSTPPVVTIAPTPTKTSSILWIGEGRQPHPQLCNAGPATTGPQVHPAVSSGAVQEEYLRGLRPFATSDDLRLRSLPLGLDPTTAAHVTAAAAYYHPAYLHHLHRMEESLCLSALRSQFYSVPAGGAFPHLHPAALHMHLPGARYPGEFSHTHSALAERYNKPTLPALPVPKPLQPGLQSAPHLMPSLVPSQTGNTHTASASSGGLHGTLASAVMLQQANGEERRLARQRRQGQEREVWPPVEGVEPRRDSYRSNVSQRDTGNRESQPHLGAPPPLISPKHHPHLLPHPPAPPTTLWNPASLTETPPDPHRRFDSPVPPSRSPPGLTRTERSPSWERVEDRCRKMGKGPERFSSVRGPILQEPGLWGMAELEGSTHSLHHHHNHHHNHLHQRGSLSLSSPSPSSNLGVQRQASSPSPTMDLQRSERPGQEPQNPVVYDEILQQHRRLKVCFLRVCGLTTLAHRDQLLHQKRRKRRRMLRERSTSPPAVRGKRKTPPPPVAPAPPLSTTLTPEEMNCTPHLEDKKDFLNMFSLSHVTSQQRRDTTHYPSIEAPLFPQLVNRTDSTTQTPQAPRPPTPTPPNNLYTDPLKPSTPPPRQPPPLAPKPNSKGLGGGHPAKRLQDLQNGAGHPGHHPQQKVPLAVRNGQNKPWERFIPKDFHQTALQSTHKTLGGSTCFPESSIKSEPSAPYHIPPLKRPALLNTSPHPINGHHPYPSPPHHDPLCVRDELSEEEDDEEEEGDAPRKWRGIESVFEAYQEYVDERGMERQELVSQRQRVRDERERLQAQLELFRKCLTIPNVHWGKGQAKGCPSPVTPCPAPDRQTDRQTDRRPMTDGEREDTELVPSLRQRGKRALDWEGREDDRKEGGRKGGQAL
ncbi:unnamed protein product [Coregonus sp. 'balchen']|nr:unnamed protein product [Coregonus sp. 'balchen']